MAIKPNRLTCSHIEDILAQENEYPPPFRLGRQKLEQKLKSLEESNCSMSWIIHDDETCVAYVIAYPQFSRLEQTEKERVIYVDDILVKPRFEICLFRLMQLFTGDAGELGLRDRPIEGICRAGAYRAFANHDPLLRRLGWELAQRSAYWDQSVQEEMCWLRWEPLQQKATSQAAHIGDHVAVSSEASQEREPQKKLVTLEDTRAYAYVPTRPKETAEEPDEFAALTEIMIGKDEDDLVEIPAVPPVDKRELQDVFGILEFIGTRKRPRSERIKEVRRERARDRKT